MSWIASVVFYTEYLPIGTPTTALLNRTPPSVNPFKIKSDYVKRPISEQGFKFIFEKMKELEITTLEFNPYGVRMSEISEFAKPFPYRSGYIAQIQYLVDWEESGPEAANQHLNLTRMIKYINGGLLENTPMKFL
ncbi:hypothetical protein L2E82_28419 [Cichorium intybus]|uniref:Uncharacterized protein n=1 Tax=Cichorium intybus TaxID=13427 RepID=A0ACB9CVP4_CICIN|nr:hypothetical protein L2E82_28419 [Cichorium intybus]